MQARPVLHAVAFAATLLFAGAAAAAQPSADLQGKPAAQANESMGTATPATKARAEALKHKIESGTHSLHEKIDSKLEHKHQESAQNDQTARPQKGEMAHHRMNRSARMNANAANSSGNSGMGSASFRREMAKCTNNEDMNARADCAREVVASHGGSSAS